MNTASIAGKQVRVIRQQQPLSISCSQGGKIGSTRETERERALRIVMAKKYPGECRGEGDSCLDRFKISQPKEKRMHEHKVGFFTYARSRIMTVELSSN